MTPSERTHPDVDQAKQLIVEFARWMLEAQRPLSEVVRRLEQMQSAAHARGVAAATAAKRPLDAWRGL